MTKEEVKAAIAAKIAGQGNQLDLSGQLDTILSAIVDLIPAPYSIPVASAQTLGGVKVGSGLGITPDGVLSSTTGPLVVKIDVDTTAKTASIATGETVTKRNIYDALVAGRPVIGIIYDAAGPVGPGDVATHCLCTGAYLGDSDGGTATFFFIASEGAVQYAKLAALKE